MNEEQLTCQQHLPLETPTKARCDIFIRRDTSLTIAEPTSRLLVCHAKLWNLELISRCVIVYKNIQEQLLLFVIWASNANAAGGKWVVVYWIGPSKRAKIHSNSGFLRLKRNNISRTDRWTNESFDRRQEDTKACLLHSTLYLNGFPCRCTVRSGCT